MTNIQFVTVIIGFISLLLAVIAGAWLNQRGLERQMDAFRNEIKAELAAIRNELKAEIAAVRSDISHLTERVQKIERQLEAIFKPILPK